MIQEILAYLAFWAPRVTRVILGLLDQEAPLALQVLLEEMVRREIQALLAMLDHQECLGALEERVKKDIQEGME